MDELMFMQDMTDSERMLFQSEMSKVRKDRVVALLLTLFLGGFGAHRYYMGQVGLGVLYTLFCWTFIPGIVALVELFLIMGRVDRHNSNKAQEIAFRIKNMTAAKEVAVTQ